MNYIIMDTNYLHLRDFKDYSKFELHNKYIDVQGRIERMDVTSLFKILIPEIVLEELKQQQLAKFREDFNNLNTLSNKFNNYNQFNIELPKEFDYERYLNQKLSEYKARNSIETIKLKNDKDTFTKIINKSIFKLPPFEGKTNKSDKGFKDALIWETILEFAQHNPGKYYFLTADKGFKIELKNEFNELCNNSNIEFISTTDLTEINQIIENSSEEKINKEKFKRLEDDLSTLLPHILDKLKNETLNNITINNIPNYNIDAFDVQNSIYDLTDINDSVFEFHCNGNLLATKQGNSISLYFQVFFTVTLENSSLEIESIELSKIEAYTLEGDELNITDFKPIKLEYEIDNYDEDENYQYNNENNNISNSIMTQLVKSNKKPMLNKNNKNIINKTLNDNSVFLLNSEELDALYKLIENNVHTDWALFNSKKTSMTLAIKKFLATKNINNPKIVAESLVNELINMDDLN
ncbi:PIN domain-containing protein [Staphylococcus borealis]|uniref:PIN domain-containing protein n=1 Tax=Staphylococcus borealis TaxID=2742203 RepID=UPI002A813558|nr:PIN domain-containing protein [Staphylococcus borealis]MDY4021400.1 PIN domain-containing protein [Staphylococcus borealis]